MRQAVFAVDLCKSVVGDAGGRKSTARRTDQMQFRRPVKLLATGRHCLGINPCSPNHQHCMFQNLVSASPSPRRAILERPTIDFWKDAYH